MGAKNRISINWRVCYCDLGRGGAERSECPPARPRVSALAERHCLCRSCRGRSTERRGIPRLGPGGCAPPPPPRPLSLDRQRKGGKKARPWRTSQGLLPATRYACPPHLPAHGRCGSRTRRPTPKSPAARMLPSGAKKRRAGRRTKKTHHH